MFAAVIITESSREITVLYIYIYIYIYIYYIYIYYIYITENFCKGRHFNNVYEVERILDNQEKKTIRRQNN